MYSEFISFLKFPNFFLKDPPERGAVHRCSQENYFISMRESLYHRRNVQIFSHSPKRSKMVCFLVPWTWYCKSGRNDWRSHWEPERGNWTLSWRRRCSDPRYWSGFYHNCRDLSWLNCLILLHYQSFWMFYSAISF